MKIGVACEYTFQNKPARSFVHSNNILNLLERLAINATPPQTGNGTVGKPFKPTTLDSWYFLATQPLGDTPMFVEVGGRLIARWGKVAKGLVNYCTDVTEEKDVRSRDFNKPYGDYVAGLVEKAKEADRGRMIDASLPAYSRKALRVGDLDDGFLASRSRLLLSGAGECPECPELASSLCSLFIAEASRAPATFVISLMLLDLVETKTTYGRGGEKTYTWKSMLMHDTGGIPGRGKGVKALGKHPMAGKETADWGRDVLNFYDKLDNPVRRRVISIMCVWLAHHLAKNNPKFKYFIIEGKAPVDMGAARDLERHHQILRKNCQDAVNLRCKTLDLLIGGTSVDYQDIEGKLV